MEATIKFAAFLTFSAIAVIWEGFVLSVLWSWFIVPVFNAPALRVPYAIGLAIVVSVLTSKSRKSGDVPDAAEAILNSLIGCAFFLLIGWVVKWFV